VLCTSEYKKNIVDDLAQLVNTPGGRRNNRNTVSTPSIQQ